MAADTPAATATPCSSRLRASGFVWLFLGWWRSLGRRRALTSTLHLRMALGGHFLLLVVLSGHLLLMMLSIHLLLMIHRLLPMSRAFVLDSFVVGAGLVSLKVVIVAVKIFSLVFVSVILGPKLLGMFCTAHSRLVFTFSRSRTLKVMFIYVPRFVASSRSCCSPCGPDFLSTPALANAF